MSNDQMALRQSHSTGVVVKGLEWMNHGPHDQTADSAVGQYRILVMDGDWVLFLPGIMPGVRYKSQVTAWTAAQADFERRILSALSPVHKDGEPVATLWVNGSNLDAGTGNAVVAARKPTAGFDRPLYTHPKEAEVTVTEEMVEAGAKPDGLVERDTHLLEWLDDAYVHCQHGSQDWCESYLHNAGAVIRSQATVIQTLQRERDELRAALRPFAERAVGYEHLPAFETDARFQHLRRARLLLKEGK